MDLTTMFYREIVGRYPFTTKWQEAQTRCSIAYFKESGIRDEEIFKFLPELYDKGYVEPEDAPDSFWEGSLTEKGKFYCHRQLQLLPPDPIIRRDGTFLSYDFYQEMKIRYTMKDLLKYFYLKTNSYSMIKNDTLFSAQFDALMKKYRSSYSGVQALDIILSLIDEAAYQRVPVVSPFNVAETTLENIVVNRLRHTMAEKHAKNQDKIVWRKYLLEKGKVVCRIEKK